MPARFAQLTATACHVAAVAAGPIVTAATTAGAAPAASAAAAAGAAAVAAAASAANVIPCCGSFHGRGGCLAAIHASAAAGGAFIIADAAAAAAAACSSKARNAAQPGSVASAAVPVQDLHVALPEDALARRLCAEPPRSDSCSRLQRLRTASSERPGSCAAITRQRQPSFSTPLRMSASSSALHSLRGSADTCIRRFLVESAAVVASYFLLALMSAVATTAGVHRGLRAEGDAPEGSTFTLGCESAWVPELKPSKRHALTSASMEGDQDASLSVWRLVDGTDHDASVRSSRARGRARRSAAGVVSKRRKQRDRDIDTCRMWRYWCLLLFQ